MAKARPFPKRRTSPDETGPETTSHAASGTKPSITAQLRTRRESSWRLPPMPCGHHDPLDCRSTCEASR
jgi:hypothetical protein